MKLKKLRKRVIDARIIRATMNGHGSGNRVLRMLSAANGNIRQAMHSMPQSGVKPGAFEARVEESGNSPSLALITGLLVIYPVFASVAIVLAGFWFLGVGAA